MLARFHPGRRETRMALQGLFWPNIARRDIHLVPGAASPRIDQLLAIQDSTGNTFASSPPAGVTVAFSPRFFGTPASHSLTVDTNTGKVTVSALPAPPLLRNFIIDCTATEGATSFTRMIRVHIHPAIRRHWVTPSRLRVPLGARNMRFSVMAEFTDGTVGDITNWGAFDTPTAARNEIFVQTHSAPPRPAITWVSGAAGIGVLHPRTGVLTGNAANAVGVQIGATLDAVFLQPVRMALADGAPAWSTATPVTHITGPLAQMNDRDVQNFLILPDGFDVNDQIAFETLADNLVNKLITEEMLTPWSHLDHKMNYFRAWVPSPEAGLTTLNEVHRFNKVGANADAFEFEQPRAPGPGIPALAAMLHSVGLPVPVDDPDGQPMINKILPWGGLYGLPALANTSAATYTASGRPASPGWMDLNDRVVLNERATAFHIAMGERPAAELGSESRSIDRHPMRFSVEDFEDFLSNLEDRPNHKVGATWTIGQKDHANVLILCRTLHFGGTNGFRVLPANLLIKGRLICIAIGNDSRNRITTNPAGNGFDIQPDPIPATAGIQVWTRAAHEYAHSLGLEDEYGDRRGGRYPNTQENRDTVARAANVQMRHTLLVANSLDARDIKWR